MKAAFGGNARTALPWEPLPLMEDYLENLEADGRDPSYIRAVKVAFSHFSTFAREQGIQHPDEITRSHVLRFQVYVNGLTTQRPKDPEPRALSEQYRQQILKYIRTWVAWLVALEHVTANPWVRIRIGRVRKVPKPIENDDMQLLFDTHNKQAFAISPFFFHRREVILVLLYGWGLRIHELAALTVSGMNLSQDFVTVRNKRTNSGKKEKVMPYSDLMKETVGKWLAHRPRHADPTVDALLITSEGRPLSTDMIYKIITELGRHAGVTINPHRLRDSFGTTLLDEGVDVDLIKEMMGHTRREQTLAYSRASTRQMKKSHDAAMGPILKGLLRQ